jgi:arylsulfatase A-like enzyme
VINPPPKGNGEWELYDISVDPSEMNNLAEEMPTLVEKLKDGYKKYEDENGVIPVPEDYDISKQLIKNSERGKLH